MTSLTQIACGIRQNEQVQWRPRRADPVEFDALTDGIPAWLRIPVWRWIAQLLTTRDYIGDLHHNIDLVMAFDVNARRRVPVAGIFASRGFDAMIAELGDEGTLDLADFLTYRNARADDETNQYLEDILAVGGSAWRVGVRDGQAGLERRVAASVQEAADAAMSIPGHAGTLLSEGWHAAFGRNPDYELAYAKAVKAVEAAVIPVVSPTNRTATLGTVISQMRDQGDWSLHLTREHDTHPTKVVVLGMVQMLWTGHGDRHAGQPGYAPSTRAEAEAAIFLAVPLLQWFSSGAVARR